MFCWAKAGRCPPRLWRLRKREMTHQDGSGGVDAGWDEIQATARTWNYDAYLAATLAPRNVQPDLIVLAAFAGDIERIILTVSEPTVAAIRLQWWHDSVSHGAASGSPIADAVGDVVRRHGLPTSLIIGYLEARELELYADPVPDLEHLERHFTRREGAVLMLAARILGQAPAGQLPDVIAKAARLYGLARTLAECRQRLNRQQTLLPADIAAAHGIRLAEPGAAGEAEARALIDHLALGVERDLAELRPVCRRLDRVARTTLLTVALIPAYLHYARRQFDAAMASETGPSRLTRAWLMAKAHWLGRF